MVRQSDLPHIGALIEEVRFAIDSPVEGGVTSELVSGNQVQASFWHFIPACNACARAHARERRGTGALAAPLGTEHWSEHRLI
jgi:hypothetical protein